MKNKLIYQARNLRKRQTPHENKLWYHLRNRNFGKYKFRRQFPIGNYIADFCCYEKKLIIEVDGSQHNEDINMQNDFKRDEYLKKLGYRVIRFWNNNIDDNIQGVLERIFETLN